MRARLKPLLWLVLVCFVVSHHLAEPLHQALHWAFSESCANEYVKISTPVSLTQVEFSSHSSLASRDSTLVCSINQICKTVSSQIFSTNSSLGDYDVTLEATLGSPFHSAFVFNIDRFSHLSRGPPAFLA